MAADPVPVVVVGVLGVPIVELLLEAGIDSGNLLSCPDPVLLNGVFPIPPPPLPFDLIDAVLVLRSLNCPLEYEDNDDDVLDADEYGEAIMLLRFSNP